MEEESSFIQFFVQMFGKSHPYLAAHTLAEWATATGIELITVLLIENVLTSAFKMLDLKGVESKEGSVGSVTI